MAKRFSIKEAIKKASLHLTNLENPQKEARLLLCHFLQKDSIYLTLHEDELVDEKFFALVEKRKQEIPLEYITKEVSFYDDVFFIDFDCLIPRPETEILIDEVLKLNLPKNPLIAEIGVGSGIISIILQKKLDAKVIASDINQNSLKVAKKNIELHKADIKLVHTSYLDGIDAKFDIIVSNPPYIKNSFKIDKNLTYEPKVALFGGEAGDEILKNIVDLAIIKKPKFLVCEMGYDQKSSLTNYFQKKNLDKFYFYKDLAGFDRGFVVEFD